MVPKYSLETKLRHMNGASLKKIVLMGNNSERSSQFHNFRLWLGEFLLIFYIKRILNRIKSGSLKSEIFMVLQLSFKS